MTENREIEISTRSQKKDKNQTCLQQSITPREMVDLAGDIADYAIKKASESGKAVSGRDMESIIALVGIILPSP